MYKEIVKNDSSGFVFGIISLGVVFILFTQYLFRGIQYYKWILDIISIGFISFSIYYTVKHKLPEFRYYILEDCLVFEKVLGTRIIDDVKINFEEILSMEEIFSKNVALTKPSLNFSVKTKKKYVISYKSQEIENKIIFSPSSEFLNFLSPLLSL